MLELFLAAASLPIVPVEALTPRYAPAPTRFEARGGTSSEAYVSARIIDAERVRYERGVPGGALLRRAALRLEGVDTPLELIEFP